MIISISNQKGGVAKTTTALALAIGLYKHNPEFKILAIDMDQQRNMSSNLNANSEKHTIHDVLNGSINIMDAIIKRSGIDFIPSSKLLAKAETEFSGEAWYMKAPFILRDALEGIKSKYDFIIIDTPPSLGILVINALAASDRLIIPITTDAYAFDGLSNLEDTVKEVLKHGNKNLVVDGILLCRRKANTTLDKDLSVLLDSIAKNFNTKVYESSIRDSVAIREAQASKSSIYDYAPKHDVTGDYTAFIREFLRGVGLK